MLIERLIFSGGSGSGDGERDREDGVGSKFAFISCSIEIFNHEVVEFDLIAGIFSLQGR